MFFLPYPDIREAVALLLVLVDEDPESVGKCIQRVGFVVSHVLEEGIKGGDRVAVLPFVPNRRQLK